MAGFFDYFGARRENYAKFFCMNCKTPNTVFLNKKGEGKVCCTRCRAEIKVKRCRDSFHLHVFEPEYEITYYPDELDQMRGA